MKTLVTGAAGFIGSHVIDRLIEAGESVRALVRQPQQGDALRDRGLEVAVGDVRDPAAVQAAVDGVDVVQHCAAATGPAYSKAEIYAINLDGVRNVLDALRRQGKGRLVLLSSINVLGTCNLDHATEDFPCRRAKDPHADVKIDAEALATQYHRQHGTDATILRPGLVYGPRERNVPTILDAIRRGKFTYIGSRDNIVPMLHISDLVQAMRLAATSPGASGRIYHVTDGAQTTMGEFIEYLAQLIDCPAPQKVLPYFVPHTACVVFEWLERLHLVKGHGPITRVALRFLGTSRLVEIERARKELGYEPKVNFRDGLAATVAWITEHANV
jgi:nucleoside-diphosphate-sugar epimerase